YEKILILSFSIVGRICNACSTYQGLRARRGTQSGCGNARRSREKIPLTEQHEGLSGGNKREQGLGHELGLRAKPVLKPGLRCPKTGARDVDSGRGSEKSFPQAIVRFPPPVVRFWTATFVSVARSMG